MDYRQAFDGGICVDALEMIPPEEWPLVLRNFHRALRPQSSLYLTIEITSEAEIARAFTDAQREGLPVVYGEWAYESGYQGDWAQDGGYHFYPGIDQVKTWLQEAGYHLIEEDVADEYHHFLVHTIYSTEKS